MKTAFIEVTCVANKMIFKVIVNINHIVDVSFYQTEDKTEIRKAVITTSQTQDGYFCVVETFEQIRDAIGAYTSILKVKE